MSLECFEIKEFYNYEIIKDGKIRNKTTLKEKKIIPGKRGYPVVSLRKDGKLYLRTIHVLLARQFIPNENNLPQVNILTEINGIILLKIWSGLPLKKIFYTLERRDYIKAMVKYQ